MPCAGRATTLLALFRLARKSTASFCPLQATGAESHETLFHPRGTVDDMSEAKLSGDMADGCHLVVEALKLNGVDRSSGWRAFRSPACCGSPPIDD
jgi:hypothetical protein